jgi:hypothetical protein
MTAAEDQARRLGCALVEFRAYDPLARGLHHFLIQVGTGLRSGELLGLRRRRVFPELGRIEVIEVRYEAGRFGRGFKAEPKSLASVRVVPMCDRVRQAIARQLTGGTRPEDLVLPGPGGSNGIPRGARAPLSTTNLRRVYKAAARGPGHDAAPGPGRPGGPGRAGRGRPGRAEPGVLHLRTRTAMDAPGKPFFFRAPPRAVELLALLGTDCVTLANNHALDSGVAAAGRLVLADPSAAVANRDTGLSRGPNKSSCGASGSSARARLRRRHPRAGARPAQDHPLTPFFQPAYIFRVQPGRAPAAPPPVPMRGSSVRRVRHGALSGRRGRFATRSGW